MWEIRFTLSSWEVLEDWPTTTFESELYHGYTVGSTQVWASEPPHFFKHAVHLAPSQNPIISHPPLQRSKDLLLDSITNKVRTRCERLLKDFKRNLRSGRLKTWMRKGNKLTFKRKWAYLENTLFQGLKPEDNYGTINKKQAISYGTWLLGRNFSLLNVLITPPQLRQWAMIFNGSQQPHNSECPERVMCVTQTPQKKERTSCKRFTCSRYNLLANRYGLGEATAAVSIRIWTLIARLFR